MIGIGAWRPGRQTAGMVTGRGPSLITSRFWAGSLRVRRVAGAVSVLAVVSTVILALAAVVSHQTNLWTAALGALVVSGFANGVIELLRACFLWRTGAWASLSGQRHTREQQPARFSIWLTFHLIAAIIWIGVAGYLTSALAPRL